MLSHHCVVRGKLVSTLSKQQICVKIQYTDRSSLIFQSRANITRLQKWPRSHVTCRRRQTPQRFCCGIRSSKTQRQSSAATVDCGVITVLNHTLAAVLQARRQGQRYSVQVFKSLVLSHVHMHIAVFYIRKQSSKHAINHVHPDRPY